MLVLIVIFYRNIIKVFWVFYNGMVCKHLVQLSWYFLLLDLPLAYCFAEIKKTPTERNSTTPLPA